MLTATSSSVVSNIHI